MNFQKGYWKLTDWRGTAVLLHASLLLWPVLQLLFGASPFGALLSLPAFVVLMGAHEFGHAIMARRRGSRARSIRLYLFHGLCEYEAASSELDDVLIAWGGVLAQMALLVAALVLQFLLNEFVPPFARTMQPVFTVLIVVNCYVALLNLLPIKGLDGRKAWLIIVIALDRLRSRSREGYADWSRRHSERNAMRASKAMADDLIERIRNK
jgi:Zn-dependent protease